MIFAFFTIFLSKELFSQSASCDFLISLTSFRKEEPSFSISLVGTAEAGHGMGLGKGRRAHSLPSWVAFPESFPPALQSSHGVICKGVSGTRRDILNADALHHLTPPPAPSPRNCLRQRNGVWLFSKRYTWVFSQQNKSLGLRGHVDHQGQRIM